MGPSIEELVEAGFAAVGDFPFPDTGATGWQQLPPDVPGVYLFALGSQVVYVGAAKTSLLGRLRGYVARFGGPVSHRPERPVHRELRKCRDADCRVATYCLSLGRRPEVPEGSVGVVLWHATWNRLPVRLVAGVEYGLIDLLQPQWNRHGAAAVAIAPHDSTKPGPRPHATGAALETVFLSDDLGRETSARSQHLE
ncbi:MAG: hypothetical protein IT555_04000 [Acetobacteraceae bacterium]|nr:hypothetical protein [Acetobacteraceae bacterium]